MDSIACIRPDMAVLDRNKLTLSPFGALSQALAEEILARTGQAEGAYPYVPLDLLAEPESEPAAPTSGEQPAVNLELKLVIQRPEEKSGERDGERQRTETVQRIVERIVRLREAQTAPGRSEGQSAGAQTNIYQSFYQTIDQHLNFTAGLTAASPDRSLSAPGGAALRTERFTEALRVIREEGVGLENTTSAQRGATVETAGEREAPARPAITATRVTGTPAPEISTPAQTEHPAVPDRGAETGSISDTVRDAARRAGDVIVRELESAARRSEGRIEQRPARTGTASRANEAENDLPTGAASAVRTGSGDKRPAAVRQPQEADRTARRVTEQYPARDSDVQRQPAEEHTPHRGPANAASASTDTDSLTESGTGRGATGPAAEASVSAISRRGESGDRRGATGLTAEPPVSTTANQAESGQRADISASAGTNGGGTGEGRGATGLTAETTTAVTGSRADIRSVHSELMTSARDIRGTETPEPMEEPGRQAIPGGAELVMRTDGQSGETAARTVTPETNTGRPTIPRSRDRGTSTETAPGRLERSGGADTGVDTVRTGQGGTAAEVQSVGTGERTGGTGALTAQAGIRSTPTGLSTSARDTVTSQPPETAQPNQQTIPRPVPGEDLFLRQDERDASEGATAARAAESGSTASGRRQASRTNDREPVGSPRDRQAQRGAGTSSTSAGQHPGRSGHPAAHPAASEAGGRSDTASGRTGSDPARTAPKSGRTGAETAGADSATGRTGAGAGKTVSTTAGTGTEPAKSGHATTRTGEPTGTATGTTRTGAGQAATAKSGAEPAKTGTATGRTGAEPARTGTATGRTGAESARTGTVTGRTGAEPAKTGTAAAKTDAGPTTTRTTGTEQAKTGSTTARTVVEPTQTGAATAGTGTATQTSPTTGAGSDSTGRVPGGTGTPAASERPGIDSRTDSAAKSGASPLTDAEGRGQTADSTSGAGAENVAQAAVETALSQLTDGTADIGAILERAAETLLSPMANRDIRTAAIEGISTGTADLTSAEDIRTVELPETEGASESAPMIPGEELSLLTSEDENVAPGTTTAEVRGRVTGETRSAPRSTTSNEVDRQGGNIAESKTTDVEKPAAAKHTATEAVRETPTDTTGQRHSAASAENEPSTVYDKTADSHADAEKSTVSSKTVEAAITTAAQRDIRTAGVADISTGTADLTAAQDIRTLEVSEAGENANPIFPTLPPQELALLEKDGAGEITGDTTGITGKSTQSNPPASGKERRGEAQGRHTGAPASDSANRQPGSDEIGAVRPTTTVGRDIRQTGATKTSLGTTEIHREAASEHLRASLDTHINAQITTPPAADLTLLERESMSENDNSAVQRAGDLSPKNRSSAVTERHVERRQQTASESRVDTHQHPSTVDNRGRQTAPGTGTAKTHASTPQTSQNTPGETVRQSETGPGEAEKTGPLASRRMDTPWRGLTTVTPMTSRAAPVPAEQAGAQNIAPPIPGAEIFVPRTGENEARNASISTGAGHTDSTYTDTPAGRAQAQTSRETGPSDRVSRDIRVLPRETGRTSIEGVTEASNFAAPLTGAELYIPAADGTAQTPEGLAPQEVSASKAATQAPLGTPAERASRDIRVTEPVEGPAEQGPEPGFVDAIRDERVFLMPNSEVTPQNATNAATQTAPDAPHTTRPRARMAERPSPSTRTNGYTPQSAGEIAYPTSNGAETASPIFASRATRFARSPERSPISQTASARQDTPAARMAAYAASDYAAPVELTYNQPPANQSPPPPEPGVNGPEQPGIQDSDYVKSLPDWAQRFLKEGPGTATSARSISSLPQQTAPETPEIVEWTAPGYRAPAETKLKEIKPPETQSAPEQVHISEAEIKRTADRVYKLIEDRIRRERRRLGF